jgi:hypothetical protein
VEGRRIRMSGGSEMVASSPSLDIKKNNRNKACSKRCAVGPVVIDGEDYIGYSRLYCKRWSCKYCGPIRAAELCKSIARAAKEKDLSRFLTLTLDKKIMREGVDEYKYIRNVWTKFRVYLGRKYGESISFISVMELHKSGVPHLHVLVDRYIKQQWISAAWSRLGGGKIVHIEKLKNLEKIGWYLGKYLTKDAILRIPEGVRRFSSSRDIKIREEKKETEWRFGKYSMEVFYECSDGKAINETKDENGYLKFFATKKLVIDVRPKEYRGQKLVVCDIGQVRSLKNGKSGSIRQGIE